MFQYKVFNHRLNILSTINNHNLGYDNSNKRHKYTTKSNTEFSKFTNISMSLFIYKRVLDRDGIYRVKVIKFNRFICYYLVSSKEANIDSDM